MKIHRLVLALSVIPLFSFAGSEYFFTVHVDGFNSLVSNSEQKPDEEIEKEEKNSWLDFLISEKKFPESATSLSEWSGNKIVVNLSDFKYTDSYIPQEAIDSKEIYSLSLYGSQLTNHNFLKNINIVRGTLITSDKVKDISGLSSLKGVSNLTVASKSIVSFEPLKSLVLAVNLNLQLSNIDSLAHVSNISNGNIAVGMHPANFKTKPMYNTPLCQGISQGKVKVAISSTVSKTIDVSSPIPASSVCMIENEPWLHYLTTHFEWTPFTAITKQQLIDNHNSGKEKIYVFSDGVLRPDDEMYKDRNIPSEPIISSLGIKNLDHVSLSNQVYLKDINWMRGIEVVDKDISLKNATSMTNITGMSDLVRVNRLDFSGSSSLNDLSPLSSLRYATEINLVDTNAGKTNKYLKSFLNLTNGTLIVNSTPEKISADSAFCRAYSTDNPGLGTVIKTQSSLNDYRQTTIQKDLVCM